MTDAGPTLWRVALATDAVGIAAFSTALESDGGRDALALATFEANPDGTAWLVEALYRGAPDRPALTARVAAMAAALGLAPPALELAPVPDRDWRAQTQAAFPPRRVGRFFLHGSHWRGLRPPGSWPLRIDASYAFGTGEHGTTGGCLAAIDRLARSGRLGRGRHARALDLGCGSGILALGRARAAPGRVVASDCDPDAVRLARLNARANGLAHRVRAVRADGTRHPAIRAGAPYRLIVANILARPVIRLAPELCRLVGPGAGHLVLSGFLQRHEAAVLAAYRARGCRLVARLRREGWSVLVVRRRGSGRRVAGA